MDSSNNLVGKTIGKYQMVQLLGRGGMAEVYKAYQSNLDRHVAIKLMHAFLAEDKDFIGRFEREAKNVAALRHPNIIQVYDFDVYNGMPYMVMEYIEGRTLKEHLEELAQKGQTLPLTEAVRIISETGHALAYAHQHGMMHRDVKPANVMLDVSGRVILTDFGIAKILTGPSFTATGATIGTPSYMSPEQGMGRTGDHRSDIYSLGVMLYQLSTGQLPFDADTPLAVMLKHVSDPLPLPRTVRPNIPEGLERVILKSMAKNPDDRFNSVDDMVTSLANLEGAAQLAVPSSSMAGGVSASAPTVAMRPATPAAAVTPVPSAGPVVTAPTLATVPASAQRGLPLAAIAIIGLVVVLLLGGGAFAVGYFLIPRPTASPVPSQPPPTLTTASSSTPTEPLPTATELPGTSTPNAVETQLAMLQATQNALFFTPTPTETPDLTQTAAACTYSYEASQQEPPNNKTLPVGARPFSVTLTLKNTGTCAFPDRTVLVETNAPTDTAVTLSLAGLAPQAETQAAWTWITPKTAGDVTRTFEIRRPDGQTLGLPLTITYKFAVLATATAAPRPTATPAPATPTAAAAGLTDIYPAGIISCAYEGQNNMDYNCTAYVGYAGGTGRMTLYLDGQNVGSFQPGERIYYNIVSRRCTARPYNLRLVDDGTVTQISRDFYFDPNSSPLLFPGGGCTLP